MEWWRSGDGRAETQAAAAEELRDNMRWWWRALESRSAKSLQFAAQGGFALHPHLRGLRDEALSMGPDAAITIYTDAAGSRG